MRRDTPWITIRSLVTRDASPHRIGWGAVLGLALGLPPLALPVSLLPGMALLTLRVHLPSALAAALLSAAAAPWLWDTAHHLGTLLLVRASVLAPVWRALQEIPLLAYTRVLHTLVLGSWMLVALSAWPVYVLAVFVARALGSRPSPRKESRLRPLGLAVALVAPVLLAGAHLLWLDDWLKARIIRQAEFLTGVPVTLDRVHIDLRTFTFTVSGVRLSSPVHPSQAVLSAETIWLRVLPYPLWRGRLHLQDIRVDGLRVEPPATGEPWTEPPSWLQPAGTGVRDRTPWTEQPAWKELPSLSSILEAKFRYSPLTLKSAAQAETLNTLARIETRNRFIQSRSEALRRRLKSWYARMAAAEPNVKTLESIPVAALDPASFEVSLEPARESLRQWERLLRETAAARRHMERTFGTLAELNRELSDWQIQDARDLALRHGLPWPPSADISGALFGPAWSVCVRTFRNATDAARLCCPVRPNPSDCWVRPSPAGWKVEYPALRNGPDWQADCIRINGWIGRGPKALPIQASLEGLASDSRRSGNPIHLSVAGMDQNQSLRLDADVDHARAVPMERLRLTFGNLQGQNCSGTASEYLGPFRSGRLSGHVWMRRANSLEAHADLVWHAGEAPQSVTLPDSDHARLLEEFWHGLDALSLCANADENAGRWQWTCASNLETGWRHRLAELEGPDLLAGRLLVLRTIHAVTADRRNALLDQWTITKSSALASLDRLERTLRERLDRARARLAQIQQSWGTHYQRLQEQREQERLERELRELFP